MNIKHYTKNRKRQSTNRTRKVANNQTQHTINCFRHGTHQTQSTVIVIIRYTNLARNTQMKTVKLRETFPFICWPCKVFSVSLSSSCLWYRIFGFSCNNVFSPMRKCTHNLLVSRSYSFSDRLFVISLFCYGTKCTHFRYAFASLIFSVCGARIYLWH